MLEIYFGADATLARLRSGPLGPFMDDFAEVLSAAGYNRWTARGYLRAVRHLGQWMQRGDLALSDLTDETLTEFAGHLPGCTCLRRNRGVYGDALSGARLFLEHLRSSDVVSAAEPSLDPTLPAHVAAFERWMTVHRGIQSSTLQTYRMLVVELIEALGEPGTFDARRLRRFVAERAARHGRSRAKTVVTATRMFLRYAIAHGLCQAHLDTAIPTIAEWKLATLHPYLAIEEVERLVGATDTSTPAGLRDHAILLLLARLGLRAGDVVALALDDVDWATGSLRLCGKGRQVTRLPLPQDVGDALLRYTTRGQNLRQEPLGGIGKPEDRPAPGNRKACPCEVYLADGRPDVSNLHVFQRVRAPWGPLRSACAVSDIVTRTATRAGVELPRGGAHVLRHSPATRIVREGMPLVAVRAVLRHQSDQTTAHCAKLDTPTLAGLAQPWPKEVAPC